MKSSQHKSTASHTQQKIMRLLTLNTFERPPPIKTNQDDFKEERFEDILKQLDSFDLVCLQEMFQTATFRVENMIQAAI